MPFQSEEQRRFLHANHPEIAKRWEKEYSNGGILDITGEEESTTDDGNDIELTAFNAAFDDPNDLSTGVKSLFQAKDGGAIGGGTIKGEPRGDRTGFRNPHGGGGQYGGGQNTGNQGSDKDHSRFDAGYYGGDTTTTSSTDDGGAEYHHTQDTPKQKEDQKKTEALNRNIQRKKDLARIAAQTYKPTAKTEKKENTPEEKGFWDHLGTALSILAFGPVVGFKTPGIVSTLSTVVNTKKNIDKLTDYGIEKGWLDENMTVDALTERFADHVKAQQAKMDEYESLPAGHPDKIALGVELGIGTKDEWDGSRDGPEVPDVVPIHQEIQEYEDIAARAMSPFDMKARQTLNAQLQNQWEQERLAKAAEYQAAGLLADNPIVLNKGGLANLFRVKNQ